MDFGSRTQRKSSGGRNHKNFAEPSKRSIDFGRWNSGDFGSWCQNRSQSATSWFSHNSVAGCVCGGYGVIGGGFGKSFEFAFFILWLFAYQKSAAFRNFEFFENSFHAKFRIKSSHNFL